MIQQNEIIMLILGIGVVVFLLLNTDKIRRIPKSNLLLSAFYFLFLGWCFTVLEGFFWNEALNVVEHICYSIHSILLAIWCWMAAEGKKEPVE